MSRSRTLDDSLRFYGRRKGKKLRAARLDGYEGVLPGIQIALPKETVNPATFFNFPVKQVWLEIGFGNGEHLLHQALNNPGIGMIGCEPFINGVAALCADIKKHGVKNIRIFTDNARFLMAQLQDASLDRAFLLNPDPWPKTRHHKRRFVQRETLDELHRLLKPGAEFRMTTDHPDLAGWMAEKTYFHPGFDWTAEDASGWRQRPADMPETRYQNKGVAQGRPTVFLNFRRV